MRVSDAEVKKVLTRHEIVSEIVEMGEARTRAADEDLAKELVAKIVALSDREDRIAELRAKIEADEYNPHAEEIVESMVRRAIVDQVQ